jgi:hypothetical protein
MMPPIADLSLDRRQHIDGLHGNRAHLSVLLPNFEFTRTIEGTPVRFASNFSTNPAKLPHR